MHSHQIMIIRSYFINIKIPMQFLDCNWVKKISVRYCTELLHDGKGVLSRTAQSSSYCLVTCCHQNIECYINKWGHRSKSNAVKCPNSISFSMIRLSPFRNGLQSNCLLQMRPIFIHTVEFKTDKVFVPQKKPNFESQVQY